jgi:hypothetical protein
MDRVMNKTTARRLFALGLGASLSTIVASAGWAQMPMSPGAGNGIGHRSAAANATEKPTEASPDAVPGAKARAPVAPANKSVLDLPPTEALFDAINRGDIAAARDSLNRGADLNGVSILGMTPMELSVDLGRNDISFLLLSMRGEDAGRGSRAVEAHDATPPARQKKGTDVTRRTTPAKPLSVATKPVATPKLFANDGGTPQPNAGFLGFDSRGATN